MFDLKIYCEKEKNGRIKFYFLHPDIPIRVYVKPVDKTCEEVMEMLVYEGKITEWELPEYFEEE